MKDILRKTLSLILSIVFVPVFFAEANHGIEIKFMMKVDGYLDGHYSTSFFMLDPQTGQYLPVTLGESDWVVPQALQLQSAVLTRSWHWVWPELIKFGTTPDSKPHKKKFKQIINKYHNKRRGNTHVPRMKMSTQVIKVKPIEEFEDKSKFYTQLDFDENSTAVMTTDNQFFKDPNGNFYDASVMNTTKIMAILYLKQQGSRQVGTHRIEESDVYFRSGFFNLASKVYEQLGTAAFKLALGFQPTAWSHDLLSNKGHHKDRDFKPINSDLWVKISYERDDFYYKDELIASYGAAYLDRPRLLPFEDEVIDVGEYVLPVVTNSHIDLSKTSILFLTNLKGYDGTKKMIINIWRVVKTTPLELEPIVKLQGNTLDFPQNIGNNVLVYPSIFLDNVRLGRQDELTQLKNAVSNFGTPQTIDGVFYTKALRIQVKISGYLEENGKKKNISRFFWLADTKD